MYIQFRLENTLISIVTPTFNSARSVARTIESVDFVQRSGEYWVIDGGSTDATCEIVHNHKVVTGILSEPDDGIADAFNKGIERCSGELIGIINSDDWYEPQALEIVAQAYDLLPEKNRDRTIFHGDLRVHEADGSTTVRKPRLGAASSRHWSFFFDMPLNHPTCFIPRKLYRDVGGYRVDYRVAMDFELILRMKKAGALFAYIPKVLANFSAGGTSHRNARLALEEVRRAQRLPGLTPLITFPAYLAKVALHRLKRMRT